MARKTVFIGHPISGDVKNNIAKVLAICAKVHKRDVIPLAPYITALQYLDDANPDQRALGIEANQEYFRRGFVDELWLFGDRISSGMDQEISIAREMNIPIITMSEGTRREFER